MSRSYIRPTLNKSKSNRAFGNIVDSNIAKNGVGKNVDKSKSRRRQLSPYSLTSERSESNGSSNNKNTHAENRKDNKDHSNGDHGEFDLVERTLALQELCPAAHEGESLMEERDKATVPPDEKPIHSETDLESQASKPLQNEPQKKQTPHKATLASKTTMPNAKARAYEDESKRGDFVDGMVKISATSQKMLSIGSDGTESPEDHESLSIIKSSDDKISQPHAASSSGNEAQKKQTPQKATLTPEAAPHTSDEKLPKVHIIDSQPNVENPAPQNVVDEEDGCLSVQSKTEAKDDGGSNDQSSCDATDCELSVVSQQLSIGTDGAEGTVVDRSLTMNPSSGEKPTQSQLDPQPHAASSSGTVFSIRQTLEKASSAFELSQQRVGVDPPVSVQSESDVEDDKEHDENLLIELQAIEGRIGDEPLMPTSSVDEKPLNFQPDSRPIIPIRTGTEALKTRAPHETTSTSKTESLILAVDPPVALPGEAWLNGCKPKKITKEERPLSSRKWSLQSQVSSQSLPQTSAQMEKKPMPQIRNPKPAAALMAALKDQSIVMPKDDEQCENDDIRQQIPKRRNSILGALFSMRG